MKKTVLRLFCLFLALLLPLSSALGEKQPWLAPMFSNQAQENVPRDMAMTLSLDGEGIMALVDVYLDGIMRQTEEAYAYFINDEEELASFMKVTRASYENSRKQIAQYVPAAAALADHTVVLLSVLGREAHYDVQVDGKSVASFGAAFTEDGQVTLNSDLFPSYFIRLDAQTLRDELGVSGAGNEETREVLNRAVALLASGEYGDFNVLENALEVCRQGMERLEAEGETRRAGDTLVYEFSDTAYGGAKTKNSRLDELLRSGELDMDPRMADLFALVFSLGDSQSAEDNQGADITFLDRLGDFVSGANERESVLIRYALREDELASEETTVTETGLALPNADQDSPINQMLSRVGNHERWETRNSLLLTPVSLEITTEESGHRQALTVDASQEDLIQIDFRDEYPSLGQLNLAAIHLARDDAGQRITVALGLPLSFYRTLNGATEREYAEEPLEISLEIGVDNDGPGMREDVFTSLSGEEAILSLRREKAESEAPFEAIDYSALKEKTENESAFWREIRAVAIPRLNRFILTGLPAEAKSLMTPMLALVSQLAQMGK